MPFTLAGNVFMFCCYTIHICKENCPTKEQDFGFLVNCLVCVFWYLAVVFGIGLVGGFFPFSFTSIKIYVELLSL